MSLFKSCKSEKNPLGKITAKEYKQLFAEQPRELILRITGKYEKYFMLRGTNCVYRITFDHAIDPDSGELLSFPDDTYLNWVGSWNLNLRDVPIFNLSEGCCCRVLARQSLTISPSEEDGFFLNTFSKSVQFYLSELLDPTLHEPRLEAVPLPEKKKLPPKPDPYTELMQQFEEAATAQSLFLKTEPYTQEKGDYLLSGTSCVTLAREADGSLIRKAGVLKWIQPKQSVSAFQLEPLTPYQLSVRKSLSGRNEFLLVKILGESNDREFKEISNEYKEPFFLEDELGTFELNRLLNIFEGTIKLHRSFVFVSMDVEEGDTEAKAQLAQLHAIAAEFPAFTQRVKQYAAEALSSTAADWNNRTHMSNEEFQKKLRLKDIAIGQNNTSVYFECGRLFSGHDIEVNLDQAGIFTEAKLIG